MPPRASNQPATNIDLFNILPDWVWVRDLKGRILDVNAAALRRSGYARHEMVGKPIADFYFDAKDTARSEDWTKKLLKEGAGYLAVTMRDKAGKPVEVEQHGIVIELSGKKAVLIVARDVGEQLRDRRMALTLYEAFRRSNDVMFYCDRNGVILDVNEAFTKHYGWTREEAIGQNPRILRSRHSSNEFYSRMWSSILTVGHWRGEMINKTKEGKEIPLILTITAVRDPAGKTIGYISNAIDMTEHMALQARVADSEALASIGEMAAVVAHEIRNPLGSIVMAAKELASGELPENDRAVVMDVLRNESRRLNEALSNFLAFARPRELKLARANLNALIAEIVRSVESNPELVAGIRVACEFDADLKPFPMDADQMRQVVWNLLLNALQASTAGGRVTIGTGRRERGVFFEVKDTGPGIPAKVRATLFKPFQTTKQQGTGLGLAVALRVVRAHGGEISVDTGPKGTIFAVLLPSLAE